MQQTEGIQQWHWDGQDRQDQSNITDNKHSEANQEGKVNSN